MTHSNIIHFDWAIKRLLRNKANFVVLEGFLTSLLGEQIRIEKILESEGNQEDVTDKYNRVDILAENHKGELVIIEIQNTRELYYFQRMLYGVSKAITDYISIGEPYSQVRKLYSVNIVYFDLGQGKDYIYHGRTQFVGVHTHDVLHLSEKQQSTFVRKEAGELFPEYYVLRVNEFNDVARSPIDEWIEYLKTGDINEKAQAPGLAEARSRLQIDRLGKAEKAQYYRYMDNLRIQWDVITTAHEEGHDEGKAEGRKEGRKEGIKEGVEKEKIAIVKRAAASGLSLDMIAILADLPENEIEQILSEG